jgi:hypothetical protein
VCLVFCCVLYCLCVFMLSCSVSCCAVLCLARDLGLLVWSIMTVSFHLSCHVGILLKSRLVFSLRIVSCCLLSCVVLSCLLLSQCLVLVLLLSSTCMRLYLSLGIFFIFFLSACTAGCHEVDSIELAIYLFHWYACMRLIYRKSRIMTNHSALSPS